MIPHKRFVRRETTAASDRWGKERKIARSISKVCNCCKKTHTHLPEGARYWPEASGHVFNCSCGSTLLVVQSGAFGDESTLRYTSRRSKI